MRLWLGDLAGSSCNPTGHSEFDRVVPDFALDSRWMAKKPHGQKMC
jgi:hypothetical protein